MPNSDWAERPVLASIVNLSSFLIDELLLGRLGKTVVVHGYAPRVPSDRQPCELPLHESANAEDPIRTFWMAFGGRRSIIHATHAATGHGRHRCLLLGSLGDHRFSSDEQASNRGSRKACTGEPMTSYAVATTSPRPPPDSASTIGCLAVTWETTERRGPTHSWSIPTTSSSTVGCNSPFWQRATRCQRFILSAPTLKPAA
jgi:hypothetical protein